MAHNYYNVGFAMAFETTEWFRGEAARTARGLATTPTVEEAEASGSVPSVLVEIVKQRQQQLRGRVPCGAGCTAAWGCIGSAA
jgi:hypothetical protein